MASSSWLRWVRSLVGLRNRTARRVHRRHTLRVELLEDRLAPATFVWTGGSGIDNNWGTGANWQGGVAPAGSGQEDLEFPAFTAVTTTNNNLIGAAFNSLTFDGSNYDVK